MMKKMKIYNVFYTLWGWASFTADQDGLRYLVLPEKNKEDVLFETKKRLKEVDFAEKNKTWTELVEKIKHYFTGDRIDFSNIPVNLKNYTTFQKKILQTVKQIPYGKTRSYKEVAEISGYPKAYRAVGSTMKNNCIPLIIPCHRVIKSDGDLGRFSSKGGTDFKKRMLNLESSLDRKSSNLY